MSEAIEAYDREVRSAINNLQRLIAVLPMVEDQRNTILHAIKLLKDLL